MKYFFLMTFVIAPLFSSGIAYDRDSLASDAAEHNCINHIRRDELPSVMEKFEEMSCAEQAAYCLNYLQKSDPSLFIQMNREHFKQQFLNGYYCRKKEKH